MNTNAVVKKTFFVGVCLLLIVLVKSEKVHSYTLEEIMSSSFPSHLTVSPTGNLVAWVFNREGKRNLWVAEAPDYRARQLTDYSFDDGQPIEGPAFSADGSILVYVRGDVENRAGENPNPTSNPRGAEQAVWAVKIKDGQSWRLGKGNDPQTSPVENRIVLHYRGKIYSAFLKENGEEPKLLFKARGENVSSTWSPDGTRLAFVSHREDHSFIGIYHLKENRIIWVSPSVDRDVLPVWSSCGKFIAFIRFPGMSGFSYGGTGGLKFSVWVADSASGRAEEIWTCPNETGGFAQDYPAHPLRWAADDNLILYSEHEGWMHLYSLSVNEKKIIDLTPGEHEVEHSFLSADRKTLIFNSNSGDIDRRHIWIVPVT
jgi:dipeptidyl-peptidase-4